MAGMRYIRWSGDENQYLPATRRTGDTIMYVAPDGSRFLPCDGNRQPAWPPEPEDGWYCVETGQPAILGLPGSVMAVFA